MKSVHITAYLLAFGLHLVAQDPIAQNFEFSITLGTADVSLEKYISSEHMDFLNYMNSDLDYFELSAIKLGFSYDFLERMYTDINVIVMSDLVPDNYDVSVHYFFNKYLGVGLGSLYYSNYISYFEDYHKETHPDYIILDYNMRQFENYDLGFYISPTFRPIYSKRLKVALRCDFGLSSFMEEHTAFYLKRKRSNELRLYDYRTVKTFEPYINPKLNLKLRAFKIGNLSVGVIFNTNYFYSKKSMDYYRTYQVWTSDNSNEEFIDSPKHRYSRFELDGGIFFGW
jgi:hypothetical protein